MAAWIIELAITSNICDNTGCPTNFLKRGQIKLNFFVKLKEIDGPNHKAKFAGFGEKNKGQVYWVDFDKIYVTPPQSTPDFVRKSRFANAGSRVDVDKSTLQHLRYSNVFSLGDASSLPTGKTGAAVRKQANVVIANLLAMIKHQKLHPDYTGYTSCPVVTGYGKLVLAEFDYNHQPVETFPFGQSKERCSSIN